MALTTETDKTRTTATRIRRSRQDEPATLIRLIHVPANDILPFPIQFSVLRLKALTMSDFKHAMRPSLEPGQAAIPLLPTETPTYLWRAGTIRFY